MSLPRPHPAASIQDALPFAEAAHLLAELARYVYARGWALGTSGNFSAVVSHEPLRLAITPSGVDKGTLQPEHVVEVDDGGRVVGGVGRASDETPLHLTLVRQRGARAVVHTHSIWSTVLSEAHALEQGLGVEGFEMLKGLDGVRSHEHREWIPILENSQDMEALALEVSRTLDRHPDAHGFFLRRHGLYTWGRDLTEAKRHLEILEFLLEVLGREHSRR